MQARSALFDLFGDHLRPRGGGAPVAALVRLLAPLDIAAPAVRTAISRMVRQAWLVPTRLPGGAGYQLTAKAVHRLDQAAARIYRTGQRPWDGHLDLIVLTAPVRTGDRGGTTELSRTERTRVAAILSYFGYGSLDPATWISPRRAEELDPVLKEAGLAYERFTATHTSGTSGAGELVRRAWDLRSLATAYDTFVAEQDPLVKVITLDSPDEQAYAVRFRLVHAWRAFLFRDPQLPAALLPRPWPGAEAAAFFDHHASRMRPAADRFVDAQLAHGGPR